MNKCNKRVVQVLVFVAVTGGVVFKKRLDIYESPSDYRVKRFIRRLDWDKRAGELSRVWIT